MANEERLAQVRLSPDGLDVGAQGLGCMGMSEFYGITDEGAARATLETALAHGVTLFDTADMYGQGANERFLSPFVRDHRDQVVIATKFGTVRSADGAMSTAELLALIADIAGARGLSTAQIALAWLHQQTDVHGVAVVPMSGDQYPDMQDTAAARES